MSLGLTFESKKGFLSSIKGKKLEKAINKLAMSYFFKIYQLDNNTYSLDFSYSGLLNIQLDNGCIKGDFNNNIGGPGVHKEVVSFLDDLKNELNIKILVEDDTDYWNHRNFYLLKEEYLTFLKSYINLVYEKGINLEISFFLLCWPNNWKPTNKIGFITPIGIFSLDNFKKIIDTNNINKFAETFFLWLDETKDDLYHKQMALYLMWNECYWVKPRTEEEYQIIKLIKHHCAKAKEINPNIELPLDAIKDLELLTEGKTNSITTNNIGYRRNDIVVSFPGGWEATIPGTFIESNDINDHVFWDNNRNFRLTSFTLDKDFESKILKNHDNKEELINENIDGINYVGSFAKEEKYWYLQGEVGYKNNIAIVTITYTIPEYKNWAIETFKKVKKVK